MSPTYVVNAPRVIHETLDGEVVAIDLGSGAYFSMRDSAAVAWDAIVAGLDTAGVIDHVTATHAPTDADIAAEIEAFVADLLARELIVAGSPETGAAPDHGTGLPYETPALETFTDMADVILLDPVHDVDAAAGWPHQPAGPTDEE
ncbi:MAG: PqqD family protein [Acidimicrobiales bacterium]